MLGAGVRFKVVFSIIVPMRVRKPRARVVNRGCVEYDSLLKRRHLQTV